MKVKIVTTLEELPQFSKNEPVFMDTESEGLYVNTRLIPLYQPTTDDTIYILDLAPLGYKENNYVDLLAKSIELMKTLHLVCYNASYDLGSLNFVPEIIDCLYYATKSAYPEFQEYGLDKVTNKLPYVKGLYDGLDKKKLQKARFIKGAYLSQAQIKYTATDVLVLAKMWEDTRIQDVIQNNLAYKVDMLSLRYAVQYQQNGLVVDLETREKLLVDVIKDIDTNRAELPDDLNVNSYKQVRAYLNTEESDHSALIAYAFSDKPLASKARNIILLKKAMKQLSYLESINFDKMYTKFNVAGAATGRFTSSGGDLVDGFNSQQISRPFQKLFKADIGDTTVVSLDYATLELRIACAIFNEPEMYKQLMNGEDLHTAMAILVTGKELHPDGVLKIENSVFSNDDLSSKYVTDLDRTHAKCINFGFVFGMSAKTFTEYAFTNYGVSFSLEEATNLRNKYFSKYPAFKTYHNKIWNAYKNPGFYYTTALGRKTKPNLGTDGINGPVQGSGAETTKLAVHYLVKEYPIALDYIYNVVHDAIYLRVPKEDKQLWEDRLKSAMVKGWTEISKSSLFKFKDIPMPVGE